MIQQLGAWQIEEVKITEVPRDGRFGSSVPINVMVRLSDNGLDPKIWRRVRMERGNKEMFVVSKRRRYWFLGNSKTKLRSLVKEKND